MDWAKKFGLGAVAFLCLVPIYVFALFWTTEFYTNRAHENGQATLALVSEAVDQAIGRFVPIPALVAADPDLRQLLNAETAQGLTPYMNEKLRQVAISIEASDLYVMDTNGLTVAASNYRDEDSFVGWNFYYRPYFQESLKGKVSLYHALGTTSRERGFFFSSPILDGIEVIGVMVVKITVDEIEEDWANIDQGVLISDNNGIVFLSSRDDFLFRSLAPLTEGTRERIIETRQYPIGRIKPLEVDADVLDTGIVKVSLPNETTPNAFFATSTPLSFPGWHATVLTTRDGVTTQVFRRLALWTLTFIALVLAALLIQQRRTIILERIRIEQEQRALLEGRVKERTADLNTVNESLRLEVLERRVAEERLRKSQKELVQAGKLAALGTMSAALSHEINQPLTAIKSYAVNAREYLTRSRLEDAKANVENISKMSDRITEISHHLRNFARQPSDKLRVIDVEEVIQETIGLVGPQLRSVGAEIAFTPPENPISALGGKLRLQQVLVNIINNALEATREQSDPLIEIETSVLENHIEISIRDNGPGVAEESLDQVFDAFYTTKTAGVGMGLGMSISHNIMTDFGGSLSAGNHPDGGAVFKVNLRHGTAKQETKV